MADDQAAAPLSPQAQFKKRKAAYMREYRCKQKVRQADAEAAQREVHALTEAAHDFVRLQTRAHGAAMDCSQQRESQLTLERDTLADENAKLADENAKLRCDLERMQREVEQLRRHNATQHEHMLLFSQTTEDAMCVGRAAMCELQSMNKKLYIALAKNQELRDRIAFDKELGAINIDEPVAENLVAENPVAENLVAKHAVSQNPVAASHAASAARTACPVTTAGELDEVRRAGNSAYEKADPHNGAR